MPESETEDFLPFQRQVLTLLASDVQPLWRYDESGMGDGAGPRSVARRLHHIYQ